MHPSGREHHPVKWDSQEIILADSGLGKASPPDGYSRIEMGITPSMARAQGHPTARDCHTLIDGYNALFTLGWMPPGRAGSGGASILQAARGRLVQWIDQKAPDPGTVVIVFDGRGSREQGPIVSRREGGKRGVQVVFSQGEADDLLEEIIGRHPHPSRLSVVSDDRRIRDAASRRNCIPVDVTEWYETLDKDLVPKSPSGASGGKTGERNKDIQADLTPAEIEQLRRELGSIEVRQEKGDPTPIFQPHLVEQLRKLAQGKLPPEPRLKGPRSRKPPPL